MRSKYCIREPLLRNVTPNEGKCHYHNSFSVEFIKKKLNQWGKRLCCCCGGGKTAPWHCTPSVLVKEVVLDIVWVKHWEYKSSITFKLLSLQM